MKWIPLVSIASNTILDAGIDAYIYFIAFANMKVFINQLFCCLKKEKSDGKIYQMNKMRKERKKKKKEKKE